MKNSKTPRARATNGARRKYASKKHPAQPAGNKFLRMATDHMVTKRGRAVGTSTGVGVKSKYPPVFHREYAPVVVPPMNGKREMARRVKQNG